MSAFGNELTRLMAVRDIGVRELARQSHYSAGYISNLCSGTKNPSREAAEQLDALLEAQGKLIATLNTATSAATDGRSILVDTSSQAIELGRWVETSNVGDGTLGQLDDLIERISRDYLRQPPEPLIARAAEVARQISDLLREHQRLRHTRDLYVLGAKVYSFLSWVAGDLGQLAAAAAHGRAALIVADECGHPGARALAFCALSKTAFWDGQARRAAEFARRGYDCSPANSTRALLACQEADASDVPTAIDAIRRAWDAQAERTRDDDLGGVFACGQVRTANYSIPVHLRNGDPASAIRAADQAAIWQSGEEVGYGTVGQIKIGAAVAHLKSGELDGAVERLGGVFALPPDQRLATLSGRLREVPPELRRVPYTHEPQAADLSDRIRDFCEEAVTVRALPAGNGGQQ